MKMCPGHEQLVLFADGELDGAERVAIERHLAGCEACREFVNEMRGLKAAGSKAISAIHVSAARNVAHPPSLLDRVGVRRPLPMRRLTALAAAALILIALPLAAWLVVRPAAPGVLTSEAVDRQSPAAGLEAERVSDEAFEQWAAPYRRMRIPLVPMEEVANYEPPKLLPVRPPADEPDPES